MHAWINGSMLPDATTDAISVIDHGFTVGDGVFEAIKVINNAPFALTRHLDRLDGSAQGLGLPPVDRSDVLAGLAAVLAAETIALGRVRITYTAGPAPLGSGRHEAQSQPSLVVVAAPMGAWPETTAIVTVPWVRNERSAVAGLKTTSYAENVVALAEATRHGATEAIFANTVGNLCEGTGSNVFYVINGEIRTPTLASGCLAGVTRALVIEWCGAIEVDEPISAAEAADEVFLASTTRDVQGVHRWNDRELVAPGPITRGVMAEWAKREAESLDP
jgi:branched-chain amino acid aminotransferase